MHISRLADQLGYDSLWVAEHLMLGHNNAIMERWTTLAALAGSTPRAKLGMIHQGHFFSHPDLAAKKTATLDQISGSRFIYFVEAGYGRAEHWAYGLPYPDTMDERMAQVVDGVEITLALWQAEQPTSFQRGQFAIKDATCTPQPIQKSPPVWFGEAPPFTIAAAARYGQGWNTVPVSVDELCRRLQLLKDACAAQHQRAPVSSAQRHRHAPYRLHHRRHVA